MLAFRVGQDWPGTVPPTDGAILELGAMGDLWLFVQMKNPTEAETAALKAGFSAYSLYLSPEPPGMVVMVWKYPAPVGYLETFFHGGVYEDEDDRVKVLLTSPDETNLLTGIFLDGPKITGIRSSGLNLNAMASLRQRVAIQRPLSQTNYAIAMQRLQRFTPKELFGRGTQYRHGR
jgi:hypothetical protein